MFSIKTTMLFPKSKAYGGKNLHRSVSFEVEEGEKYGGNEYGIPLFCDPEKASSLEFAAYAANSIIADAVDYDNPSPVFSVSCIRKNEDGSSYAAAYKDQDEYKIVLLTAEGLVKSCRVKDGENSSSYLKGDDEKFKELLLLAQIHRMYDKYDEFKKAFDDLKLSIESNGLPIDREAKNLIWWLASSLDCAINSNEEDAPHIVMAGSVPENILWEDINTVRGKLIYGNCPYINADGESEKDKGNTFGYAFEMFREDANSLNKEWTEEERKLIPEFPEDAPISEETVNLVRLYIESEKNSSLRPMVNFMINGATGTGKSTAVEQIAAILKRPLLKMTCSVGMEERDFFDKYIPATDETAGDLKIDLPGSFEIMMNPGKAYKEMTGREIPEGVSPDDYVSLCDRVKYEIIRKKSEDKSDFVRVDSNYITALTRGYVLELQEVSRIRSQGTLTALNEYDRPGAEIRLANGSVVRRDPAALVIYTDNVGYESCRGIDPSVISRMSYVFQIDELSEEAAKARIKYNCGEKSFEGKNTLLDKIYELWNRVRQICEENDITSDAVSYRELDAFAQTVVMDGYSEKHLLELLRGTCINKATTDREEQEVIFNQITTEFA